jgi:fumarate reductase flavoprotein subunit
MKQLEADVVVVAAGTAGLAAAVAAAEGGAKVIAFEKASTTGGAGNMALGPFAVESRLQRLKQIPLTRGEAFKIHMDYTHWRVDARLVKAFIDKSASTIDWLEKMGVEFRDVGCHNPGFNFTWHIVKGAASGFAGTGLGANMMKVLTDRAQELGVKILLRTPAKKILKEDGRIAGVTAEDESGEEIRVKARAVIIATGGFGDNPDMIKKYTGFELGHDLLGIRVPGVVGDGLRIAWEAGAAATKITMEIAHVRIPELENFSQAVVAFCQPGLIVDQSGERFINEEIIGNPTFIANAVARQKNGCAFSILDEATKRDFVETGFDFTPDSLIGFTKAGNFDAEVKQALDQKNNNIFVADSLEELASKTGISQDNLIKTIDEYNQVCETGRDELFHKNPRYLRSVKQPKFYAARLFPNAIGSLGGIKINYRTEVLNKDDDVIPGLYAAGLDANSLYGDSYAFILPGNTMGFAINSGRIAGENAAKYASEK